MCYNIIMKLILCCDYGLDDALATVDVFAHAKTDGYTSIDLVAVAGNVPADVALCNAQKLLQNAFTADTPPVRIVDTTKKEQPFEFLKTIHGQDGMGNLFADCSTPSVVFDFDAWLETLNEPFDLLSLGPMTLVSAILQKKGLNKFIFMGGNIAEEPNFQGYEFNHALNRVAFSRAVQTPHVAITMDTCRTSRLNIQPAALRGESLAVKIANRAREMSFISGEKGCYIWDDIAVKYLRHPNWFCVEKRVDKDGNELSVARYIEKKTYQEMIEE